MLPSDRSHHIDLYHNQLLSYTRPNESVSSSTRILTLHTYEGPSLLKKNLSSIGHTRPRAPLNMSEKEALPYAIKTDTHNTANILGHCHLQLKIAGTIHFLLLNANMLQHHVRGILKKTLQKNTRNQSPWYLPSAP